MSGAIANFKRPLDGLNPADSVICAVNRHPGGRMDLVPFAELFRGDQYERFSPRRSDGDGFVSQSELRGELN